MQQAEMADSTRINPSAAGKCCENSASPRNPLRAPVTMKLVDPVSEMDDVTSSLMDISDLMAVAISEVTQIADGEMCNPASAAKPVVTLLHVMQGLQAQAIERHRVAEEALFAVLRGERPLRVAA